jgi:hypothetical protein
MLAEHMNLQDGLAIKQKGVAVFRYLFGKNVVFLWGSVVLHKHGGLLVPFLCEKDGEVVVSWWWMYHELLDYVTLLR